MKENRRATITRQSNPAEILILLLDCLAFLNTVLVEMASKRHYHHSLAANWWCTVGIYCCTACNRSAMINVMHEEWLSEVSALWYFAISTLQYNCSHIKMANAYKLDLHFLKEQQELVKTRNACTNSLTSTQLMHVMYCFPKHFAATTWRTHYLYFFSADLLQMCLSWPTGECSAPRSSTFWPFDIL